MAVLVNRAGCEWSTRWLYVSGEVWHPRQQSEYLVDGCYELSVPYHRDEELVMDIARHGPEVEVLAPAELRQKIADHHRKAAAKYGA